MFLTWLSHFTFCSSVFLNECK
uniref:Uncharacterized protein n=1 Tax=Anguilla anguilla TaxID=7936 RepID=A0A0E9PHY3_ANGAN